MHALKDLSFLLDFKHNNGSKSYGNLRCNPNSLKDTSCSVVKATYQPY